jgi:hypothetical protein
MNVLNINWKNAMHQDFGYALITTTLSPIEQYALIARTLSNPTSVMYSLISASNGDNDILEQNMRYFIVDGNDPLVLVDLMNQEFVSIWSRVQGGVDEIYDYICQDGPGPCGYMSDSTASYFTDHIMTLPQAAIYAFILNPVKYFSENMNLFTNSIRSAKYNISFKENEGFWSYAIQHLEDRYL